MFVSERYRFVFIHIHKTAGTSLSRAFEAATGERRNRFRDSELFNHALVPHLVRDHPELDAFRRWAVVRNPWDRLVSYYTFARELERPNGPRNELRIAHMRSYRCFAEYVDDLYRTWQDPLLHNPRGMVPDLERGAVWYTAQWTWLRDHDDRVQVPEFGRFERLEEDLEAFRCSVGMPPLGPLGQHHRTDRPPYTEFYDDDARDKVGIVFARDIELLGYRFGA